MAVYFCVDAGATRSRGRLYDASGKILAGAEAGPANASYDCEQAVASVLDLWRQLNAAAGRDAAHVSGAHLSIGGAGLYVQRPRDAFVARLPAFGEITTMSDGYAALVGAGSGKPCALVSIGTGVAGHRLFEDGTSIQRDAWGWVVGDRGGGCWMGTRAARHAIEVLDGLIPPSALSRAVMDRIGGIQGLLNGALANLNGQRLAAFAPLVLEQAGTGCPVASEILSRALGYLAALVRVLKAENAPLYLNGGLAEVLKPALAERIGRPVDQAQGDALAGCLLVAQGKAPPERVVFG
jgi:glucosamine kinase